MNVQHDADTSWSTGKNKALAAHHQGLHTYAVRLVTCLLLVGIELQNWQFAEASHRTRTFTVIQIGQGDNSFVRYGAVSVANGVSGHYNIVPILAIATGIQWNPDVLLMGQWELEFAARANRF